MHPHPHIRMYLSLSYAPLCPHPMSMSMSPNTHAPLSTHGTCISTKTPSHSSRPLIRSLTDPPTRPPPVVSLAPVRPLSTCVAPLLSAQSWAALRAYTKASSSTRIVAPANRTSSTCRDPSARGVLFPAPALAPPDRGPCLRSADACPLPAHLGLPPLALLWSHARPPGVYSTKSSTPRKPVSTTHCEPEALDSACQPACLCRCRLLVSPFLAGHWKTSAPRPGLQSRDHPWSTSPSFAHTLTLKARTHAHTGANPPTAITLAVISRQKATRSKRSLAHPQSVFFFLSRWNWYPSNHPTRRQRRDAGT